MELKRCQCKVYSGTHPGHTITLIEHLSPKPWKKLLSSGSDSLWRSPWSTRSRRIPRSSRSINDTDKTDVSPVVGEGRYKRAMALAGGMAMSPS